MYQSTDDSPPPAYAPQQALHTQPRDSQSRNTNPYKALEDYRPVTLESLEAAAATHNSYHPDQNFEVQNARDNLAARRFSYQPYMSPSPRDAALAPAEYTLREHSPALIGSFAQPSPEQMEDDEAMRQMLAWIPSRPQKSKKAHGTLQKPVAIPQIDVGRLGNQMPFMRAYSPALAAHDIDAVTFLAFIDNLTIAQAAPPPLQALNLVGTGVGFVPWHWAQLTSTCIGLASGVGSAVVSKTRTKLFMEKANKLYFGPRGLKASLYKHEEMNSALQFPENIPILTPLGANMTSYSIAERRLHALANYTSPLTFDVPPPAAQSNALDKLTAKQTSAVIARNKKKLEKERQKYLIAEPQATIPGRSPSTRSYESSAARDDDPPLLSSQMARYSGLSDASITCETGRFERDIHALEAQMRQINIAAEQASKSCVRPEQLDEIETARRREMLALQREAEMIRWRQNNSLNQVPLVVNRMDGDGGSKSKKERKKEKREEKKTEKERKEKRKDEKQAGKKAEKDKALKAEEKEVKTAMKMGWLVIENA